MLLCLGINHKTAPVEVREKLAFADSHLPEAIREMRRLEGMEETVVLSTCNRVEIYSAVNDPERAMESLREYLTRHFDLGDFAQHIDFYHHSGVGAAWHLFRVASGLDSMVLGETEIFGQVKKAYATAQEAGGTARRLNKLFQQAFQVGKLVRSSTRITHGSTSIGSVAVDLAEKIFGELSGCQVMIVGAGEMSRRTGKSLLSRGAKSIIVSNRSHDRAVELAEEMGGKAVRFDDWEETMIHVDIVITSTAAPHSIIHPAMVETVMKKRRGRSLFIIDIAVPRDVEPAVNELENVYLYDIDALEMMASEAREERERQIALCEAVIQSHLDENGITALAPIPDRPPTGKDRSRPGNDCVGESPEAGPITHS
ncbi:MAG: glutamyl-tRNA reductase [Verrucomicrobiales bacterium]